MGVNLGHQTTCTVCSQTFSEPHDWYFANNKYHCSKCGAIALHIIEPLSITLPDGMMATPSNDHLPFFYNGHWYVWENGTLYMLVELFEELEL
ncbi:MAG: hypothetical protein IK048_04900 [Clostridia bacterium]|nr:hypothetical protein [Clostridia bacterium]